jgi:hypothetical protein
MMALKAAQGPLVAVISAGIWESAAPDSSAGTIRAASRQPVTTQVAGHDYQGWILLPSQSARHQPATTSTERNITAGAASTRQIRRSVRS